MQIDDCIIIWIIPKPQFRLGIKQNRPKSEKNPILFFIFQDQKETFKVKEEVSWAIKVRYCIIFLSPFSDYNTSS